MKKITFITAILLISMSCFSQAKSRKQADSLKLAAVKADSIRMAPIQARQPVDTAQYMSLTLDQKNWNLIINLIRHNSLMKASDTEDLIDELTMRMVRIRTNKRR